MKRDLLEMIGKAKDLTHVIILTYSIDFFFLQSVLAPVLRRCGHPALTVFADARCVAESYARQADMLSADIGTRYRVVPVAMPDGCCFHPKAIFLSGEKEATLYIGSGNLTFGGWRDNAEIWRQFRSSVEGAGPFAAFRQFLNEIVASVPLNDAIRMETSAAYDTAMHSWVIDNAPPSALVWRHQEGPPLFSRIAEVIGQRETIRLHICAPFFDQSASAINEMTLALKPREVLIYTQSRRTNLPERARPRLPASATLRAIEACRRRGGLSVSPYVHAKVYVCELRNRTILFSGSANCSVAALFASASANAELLAADDLPREPSSLSLFEELRVSEDEPILAAAAEPLELSQDKKCLTILAARAYDGELRVAFSPTTAMISQCSVDGVPVTWDSSGEGCILLRCSGMPRQVSLSAQGLGSARCWIDHEHLLGVTASQRGVVDAVKMHVQGSGWGLSGWIKILQVVCKYLDLPHLTTRARPGRAVSQEEPGHVQYTRDQVFPGSYVVPHIRPERLTLDGTQYGINLRGLLLAAFGADVSIGPHDRAEPPQALGIDDESEEIARGQEVDTPEALTEVSRVSSDSSSEIRDRRKAKAVLEKITEGLSKREYLQNCSPEHLRQNLILATILWLEAVKREWVDEATFYTSTHRLWSILFFMREGEASGWIEHRDRNTAPSGAFVARMANPLLSACLLAWTLWLPPRDTAEYNRLILASSLAMARMPALWNGGGDDREQVREGLEKLLADIGLEELASRERAKRVRLEWDRLIQRAQALRAIEFVLGNKQSIAPARQVTQGELLYHPTLGFCVAVEAFPSKHSRNLKVLMLQDKADKPKMFHPGNYILSLQAVLRCKEFEPGGRLEKERKAVESLLCEMSGLASQA